jgi:hypothetical protein
MGCIDRSRIDRKSEQADAERDDEKWEKAQPADRLTFDHE